MVRALMAGLMVAVLLSCDDPPSMRGGPDSGIPECPQGLYAACGNPPAGQTCIKACANDFSGYGPCKCSVTTDGGQPVTDAGSGSPCVAGCWDGVSCQPGTSNVFCGQRGEVCASCQAPAACDLGVCNQACVGRCSQARQDCDGSCASGCNSQCTGQTTGGFGYCVDQCKSPCATTCSNHERDCEGSCAK